MECSNSGSCGDNFGVDAAAVETALDNSVTYDKTWILKLNGHDRFSERYTKYFTRAQVMATPYRMPRR